MKGWIKLHRRIMNHPFYEEDRVFSKFEAWTHLVMMANHADNKVLIDGKLVVVERGSFITSVRKLQERWNWSNTKAIAFLDMLESEQMIVKKSDTKKTLISLTTYDVYQGEEEEKRHENDSETTQKHTNKNVKNVNKEKDIKPSSRKRVYDESEVAYRSANYLYEQILTHSPDYKKPDLQSWADDMRKLIELDKKEPIHVARVIEWAARDSFWKSNILSANKLRLKWDTLLLQMNRGDSSASNRRNARGHTEADYQAAQRDADLPTIIRPSNSPMSEMQRQRIDERIRST